MAIGQSLELPTPQDIERYTAGPSKIHRLCIKEDWEFRKILELAREESHRGEFAQFLIKGINIRVFDMLGISEDLRDADFTDFSETPEGWHVAHTNSGTDGMERTIRAACFAESTVLVDTDNFSRVAESEMKAMGRRYKAIRFQRGHALVGKEQREFRGIVEGMRDESIATLYLTENGTTTGANQSQAIQELVRIRDKEELNTVIVVDAVSSQIIGAEREYIPDIIFWANQKQPAIGPGSGILLFNNRALARAQEVQRSGLDTGGKLGIQAAYGTNEKRMAERGQTMQTPPMGELYRERIILERMYGTDERWKEVAELQLEARRLITEAVREGELGKKGISMVTEDPRIQSTTSHVMRLPESISAQDLIKHMKEGPLLHTLIQAGYGADYKDTEIRICVYSANTLSKIHHLLNFSIPTALEYIKIETIFSVA